MVVLEFRVATTAECRSAVEAAYARISSDAADPHKRWGFAAEKRRRDVDRRSPEWRGRNPELADFIEAYEAELRRCHLIDFEDMPLIAFRLIKVWSKSSAAYRAHLVNGDSPNPAARLPGYRADAPGIACRSGSRGVGFASGDGMGQSGTT
jgi:hypothetical protein